MNQVNKTPLEFRQLVPDLRAQLEEFFLELHSNQDEKFFHPHPFTPEAADEICRRVGRDLYYSALADNKILGYGILRGWDEGFETPSLGIAIHPQARGLLLGAALMHFLHAAARQRGAQRIRLTVYKENYVARRLFSKLGYEYEDSGSDKLVGFLDLGRRKATHEAE